jgi:hypothetical protein
MDKANSIIKKQSGRKFLTVLLSILLCIVVFIGVLTGLMLSDPNAEKLNSEITRSDELGKKVLAAAAVGKEYSATQDEVNSYMEYRRMLDSNSPTAKGAVIGRTVLSFQKDNSADAYIAVQFKEKNFDVSVHFIPSFDTDKGQLVMNVQAIKIGRLPLNPSWAMALLKDALPKEFSVNGTELRKKFSIIEFNYSGISANINISDLRIENSLLKIKTKSSLNVSLFGISP